MFVSNCLALFKEATEIAFICIMCVCHMSYLIYSTIQYFTVRQQIYRLLWCDVRVWQQRCLRR